MDTYNADYTHPACRYCGCVLMFLNTGKKADPVGWVSEQNGSFWCSAVTKPHIPIGRFA